MATPADPAAQPGPSPAQSDPLAQQAKKTKIWMIVAIVLGLVAIGLGIWAVTTNSDLDNANAEVKKQKVLIVNATKDVKSEQKTAEKIEKAQLAEYKRTRHVLNKTKKTVAQQQANIAKQKQDVVQAQSQLDNANTQNEKLQAEVNLAKQQLQVAQACSSGTISAIDSVFTAPTAKAGIARLNHDLAALSKDCNQTVG